MGRFGDPSESLLQQYENYNLAAEGMKRGDRCQVLVDQMLHRGTVFFVGETEFKPSIWVGIELDEPVGKHNGSVQNKEYFKCREKHGIFLRPTMVTIGDFPEESYDDIEEI